MELHATFKEKPLERFKNLSRDIGMRKIGVIAKKAILGWRSKSAPEKKIFLIFKTNFPDFLASSKNVVHH